MREGGTPPVHAARRGVGARADPGILKGGG